MTAERAIIFASFIAHLIPAIFWFRAMRRRRRYFYYEDRRQYVQQEIAETYPSHSEPLMLPTRDRRGEVWYDATIQFSNGEEE